jgi:hypothetical protein
MLRDKGYDGEVERRLRAAGEPETKGRNATIACNVLGSAATSIQRRPVDLRHGGRNELFGAKRLTLRAALACVRLASLRAAGRTQG